MGKPAGYGLYVGCLLTLCLHISSCCCDDINLRLGRFSGFLSASFKLMIDIDINIDLSFRYKSGKLKYGIGSWAGVKSITDLTLQIDMDSVEFREGAVERDIDQDGKPETVNVLVAVSKSDPDDYRIFVSWKGDRFTLDKDSCYLAWMDDDTVQMASSKCDDTEGARVCQMRSDDESSLRCKACNSDGECVKCKKSKGVDECTYPQQEAPEDASVEVDAADDGVVDASVEVDAADDGVVDASVEVDAAEDGEVDASVEVDTSVNIDLTTCQKQANDLIDEAEKCGITVTEDAAALCEGHSSDIELCHLAFQGADMFGQGCAVLRENIVCGALN